MRSGFFAHVIMSGQFRPPVVVVAVLMLLNLIGPALSCLSCFTPRAVHPFGLAGQYHRGIPPTSHQGGAQLSESAAPAAGVESARRGMSVGNDDDVPVRRSSAPQFFDFGTRQGPPLPFRSGPAAAVGLASGAATASVPRHWTVMMPQRSSQQPARPLGMFSGKRETSSEKSDDDVGRDDDDPTKEGPSKPQAKDEDGAAAEARGEGTPLSSAMIATIGVYKNFISPLLPPACRFVPTCSQYGVQAIREFGPCRGVILTSWRILRCSPLGGRGYDPPKWPPVPYTYSSY